MAQDTGCTYNETTNQPDRWFHHKGEREREGEGGRERGRGRGGEGEGENRVRGREREGGREGDTLLLGIAPNETSTHKTALTTRKNFHYPTLTLTNLRTQSQTFNSQAHDHVEKG